MGIVSAAEKVAARSGSKDFKGIRTYTRVWLVETDDPGDGAVTVLMAGPAIGTYYATSCETDMQALVRSKTPRQLSKYLWELTISYSSEGTDPGQQQENPLQRPPQVAWGFAQHEVQAFKDLDGKPFMNSAGEPYPAEVAKRDQSRLVLTVTRNESYFDVDLAEEFQDAINDKPFFGRAKGTAKCANIRGDGPHYENVVYWQVTYEIHFDSRGWLNEQLDAGHYYWEDGDVGHPAKKRFPQDGLGVTSTEPIPLDGHGNKLSEADIKAAQFKYRTFRHYEWRDFGKLNLE